MRVVVWSGLITLLGIVVWISINLLDTAMKLRVLVSG